LVINSGGSLALPDCTTDGYVLKWNNRAQAYSCQEDDDNTRIGLKSFTLNGISTWSTTSVPLPGGPTFEVKGGERCTGKAFDLGAGFNVLSANIGGAIYSGFYIANLRADFVIVCLQSGIPYGPNDAPGVIYSYKSPKV
jgi:hypothetical protein